METKIVKVIVSGGVVQGVDVPPGVTVIVYDYDTDGVDEERIERDVDGDMHTVATYEGGPDIEPEPERRLIGYDDYT